MSGLKKSLRSAAGAFSFRKRTRFQIGSSSWAGSDLDMSSMPQSSSASQPEHHVLLQECHIKLCTTYEKDLMRLYKDCEFEHTPTFDPYFLQKTGMDAEFDLIFHNIGWDNNRSILENGCKLLTLEFICTLSFTKTFFPLGCLTNNMNLLGKNSASD
jgi:hypothetical protein